jgi:SAM-dependent methyltransferase
MQYNWLIHHVNNKSFKKVSTLIKGKVLDVGCGEKPFKEEIEKLSDAYFGVDWPSTLHKQNEIDVYADMSKPLPFKSEAVDTIVSFQVLEHLAEPEGFLLESYRVLRKQGIIILTTPFMWGVHEQPHDYYRYTSFGLKYLLVKTGYRNVYVLPNTGYWITAGLRLTYHLNRHSKKPMKFLLIPIYWFIQNLVLALDRLNFDPIDTASYTVTAVKK